MSGLIMAAQLILGLAILVTLHELGHYLAARAFGIRVEKFYLFFDAWGFKFFSITRGETEYGIGWLPLGGYVKISGMVDESLDAEQMKQPPQPWEFRSKPAWQRLIVMVAGVVMNVILGIAIYSMTLLNYDKEYLANADVTDGIYAFELGEKVGLKTGDKIVAIDDKPVERFEEALSTRVMFGAKLTINRDGKTEYVYIPDDFYRTTLKAGRGNFIGPYRSNLKIDKVVPGSPAAMAGIKKGDRIISVYTDKPFDSTMAGQRAARKRLFSDDGFKKIVSTSPGKPVTLEIARPAAPIAGEQSAGYDTILATPVISDSGMIGVVYHPDFGNYPKQAYTPGSALKFGASDAMEAITSNLKGLKQIFVGKEKASDSLQGPIGIATIYGGVWDWKRFWAITGLLSMVLAFMNILPIPALDGGHVIFLLIEAVTKRKFSDRFMERAQVAGMIILLSLMVFTIGNDIWKHIIN